MKSKKIRLIAVCFAALIVVVLINVILFTQKKAEVISDRCTTVLDTQDMSTEFSSRLNLVLVLRPEGTGYIDMSGNVNFQSRDYVAFREIKFSYEREEDDIFKMTHMELIKHASDSVPDKLMDSVFFSMSHEKARYMTVNRIHNAYIIGNLHSPVFMCVVK